MKIVPKKSEISRKRLGLADFPRESVAYTVKHKGNEYTIDDLELARTDYGTSSFEVWDNHTDGFSVIEVQSVLHTILSTYESQIIELELQTEAAYGEAYWSYRNNTLGRMFPNGKLANEAEANKTPNEAMIRHSINASQQPLATTYRRLKRELAEKKIIVKRLTNSLNIIQRVYYSAFPRNRAENDILNTA